MDGVKHMTNVIHAHKLMDFIQANPQLSSLEDIKNSFTDQFGNVRFTNCTNNIYTFDEIIDFLNQRRKIQLNSNGVNVKEEHRCDHD